MKKEEKERGIGEREKKDLAVFGEIFDCVHTFVFESEAKDIQSLRLKAENPNEKLIQNTKTQISTKKWN